MLHGDIPYEEAFFRRNESSVSSREAEAGVSARELCRKHAISDATFYIYGLPPVLQITEPGLGCCLHLSGIRKICAQMGNSHTIAQQLDGL